MFAAQRLAPLQAPQPARWSAQRCKKIKSRVTARHRLAVFQLRAGPERLDFITVPTPGVSTILARFRPVGSLAMSIPAGFSANRN
jgi:hypothetical protein